MIPKYGKYTNLLISSKVTKSNSLNAGKSYTQQNWTLPPIDSIKFNTDALKSKMNQMGAIGYVCRDMIGNGELYKIFQFL